MINTSINTSEIAKAAALLQAGKLVAFPTETVYGLGADAMNETAVRRVFAVKGRPTTNPLIVHLAEAAWLSSWAREIPPSALALAQAFWPGPLTLILKKQPQVLDIVTGGQDTVALRIPNHPVALSLLKTFGGGVVAPSANQYTHISPTTGEDVREELGTAVDFILEGGQCAVGLESTILDLSGDMPRILRPGMISVAAIADVLKMPVLDVGQTTIRVPGQHEVHYAPTTNTRLMATADLSDYLKTLLPAELPVAVIHYSEMSLPANERIQYVRLPSVAKDYAHDLYHTLRLLDQQAHQQIIIETVPATSEWDAIRDRLGKAAGRR